ncbi:cell division protein FtsW (lipid II flippase) [Thermosporothrix hazakensis]|jgi:cell division protein FtsW (lipid II flippase)|uniref:Cell division protein FtsW (Lipid II flippase) n=2 Tax=Thermosporothrix TaxID=768650 RepID=A0A326UHS9_THEHA|nr:FtsW/RodA/SpoVE family cell cycle protein [Thermosporothrix hazakensis]PZW36420.1 cell division protein FtsW (lipid II flippase) [Thermosporothrix hazakensis]BBH88887.1 cell cycle protein [Thermosporothrix sp. COM3]GCE47072.1 cell cycle protein [Thermosporothrix hazakensis]
MASHSPDRPRRYRWKELGLFIIPSLIIVLITTQLLIANSLKNASDASSPLTAQQLPTLEGLIPALGLIGAFAVVHIVLNLFFRKADQVLLPLAGLLSSIGVLMATRLGPDLHNPRLGTNQFLYALLGFGLCCATVAILRVPQKLSRYKYIWALITLALLLPALIKGVLAGDAPSRDTLGLGPFKIQPSEFAKIAIVIFFAAYLSETRDILAKGFMRIGNLRLPPLRHLGPLVSMLGIALAIFLVVHDLGLALLIYSTFLCLMYLASGRLMYVLVSLGAFFVLGFVGYMLLGYVRNRFAVVGFDVVNWDKWTPEQVAFADDPGYQIMQGLIGLCTGGLFGQGFGLGHPAGRFFIPVVESDLMLSGLGEEIGLMGLFAILGLYLLIIHRGFHIAMKARDSFSQLLAAGLTTIFAIQTLVIIAGNLKLMPLTGVPLPFLSQGGSSLFANYIIIGILLRISHNTEVEAESSY